MKSPQENAAGASCNELPKAIEHLYRVFSPYPARPGMPYCEDDLTPDEVRVLTSTPLMAIEESHLNSYVWTAISKAGELVDYKHFLPRVFHKLLYEGSTVDAEVVTGRLGEAKWLTWPAVEQSAVRSFFIEWWQHLLSFYPSYHDAESCLCAIALALDDLTPFLDYWWVCRNIEALRHLANLLDSNYKSLMEDGPLFSGWWEERPAQMEQVRQWILNPATKAILEDASAGFAHDPSAKELSGAVQQVDWVHEARAKREAI